ncbi:rod shape-determining protein [Candidatus Shapirobacteria bacterium]|nr:MAG: rod shape-determining protein [Candidatus Shapirobacteria bacterium]
MSLFRKLSIDLGTSRSLVWEVERGLVLDEPTIVAIGVEDRQILAVGEEASVMLGKSPEYIEVIKPMRNGVIADYEVIEAMLKYFLRKVMGRMWLVKPEVMLCVPAGVTQVEQRAVLEATLSAGARRAYLIDEPLAGAIGASIPVADSFGNMIVGVGGGVSEAAVISLGGVVAYKSLRLGGNKIDEVIIDYLKDKYDLVVGEQTAENIKMKIGSAIRPKRSKKMEVSGRSGIYGLPKKVEIDSLEIFESIEGVLREIVDMIKRTLKETPPELVADIMDRGIVLIGGGVGLSDFNKLVSKEIGVGAHIALEPQLCVVKGSGIAMENLEVYRRALR